MAEANRISRKDMVFIPAAGHNVIFHPGGYMNKGGTAVYSNTISVFRSKSFKGIDTFVYSQ